MKLSKLLLAVAAGLLTIMTGCQQASSGGSSSPPANPNALPLGPDQTIASVDAAGHFTQKQVYTYASGPGTSWGDIETDTYNTDGTYEYDLYSPGVTPLVQSNGGRGTYTWSPTTLMLTITITSNWSAGNWTPLAAGRSFTFGGSVLFTDHTYIFNIYVADGNGGWLNTWYNTYIDANNPANNSSSTWYTSVAPMGYTEADTYIHTNGPSSNYTSYNKSITTITGTSQTYPAGVSFAPGSTLTFQVTETSNHVQDYSSPTDTTGTPDSYQPSLSFLNNTFTNVGGAYLIASNSILNYQR